ncbi:hypothetical protein [uncultured Lamprocystis sp.]|jgi:hypothetical protein|uniref:hypothetical protein n=1 Tax=uncultured Lamprocystis sp. TaxID=543132 RepID=UPI0025DD7A6B|nr:hypothetical protein [uncultured Lamprocystis sp.]
MESDPLSTIDPHRPVTTPASPATITLTVIPEGGSNPEPVAIAPDAQGRCHLHLECLPGADAIHLEVAVGGTCRLRAEVRAQAGERVSLDLRIETDGIPALHAGSHQILFLPIEPIYGPLPPIPPPHGNEAWDCCLVIDATARCSRIAERTRARGPADAQNSAETDRAPADQQEAQDAAPAGLDTFLLNCPDQWGAIVESVVELIRQLGQPGPNCRLAVIAFGDEPPAPGVFAADLVPRFHLLHLPDNRPAHLLMPLAPERLSELLNRQIKATPGADFVDALADALIAAGQLQWGDRTRRLLVLIGDSPGHATAHPVPYGGDALARRGDVDAAAAHLHRDRVTLMTLYQTPPAAITAALLEAQSALIDHARTQYRRLASVPELAFTTADFDPQAALTTLRERTAPLGRGPCWGRLVQHAAEEKHANASESD